MNTFNLVLCVFHRRLAALPPPNVNLEATTCILCGLNQQLGGEAESKGLQFQQGRKGGIHEAEYLPAQKDPIFYCITSFSFQAVQLAAF